MPPRSRDADPSDRVPQPGAAPSSFKDRSALEVVLPAGGRLSLSSQDEVIMWEETSQRYIDDYDLKKANDLLQLGGILSQALMMYRAQKDLANPDKAMVAQATIKLASDEIRKAEKALGVDKATREKGGQHTVADYVTKLKRAAHAKGVRISERVMAYEKVMMEAKWKIRVLRNGDKEDRDYHRVTADSIITWLEQELAVIEEQDKTWAREQGAVFVGKL